MSPVIVIKLEDPRYCDDCPCVNSDYEQGSDCNLGYWGSQLGEGDTYREVEKGKWRHVRPDKCRQERGE